MKYIILGTAGHIDHGKSSLVKALTGTDPDRLKEEKERGITLDLGFASLDLPGGSRLGIVDVPGHEGLIKNMLAGVGGIDIVMLVVAADEGIMPQTREHLSICDLLHIKKGLIAITKTDMVDKNWLDLVTDEVRMFVKGSFLEKAAVVPVSSKTGENLDALVKELDRLAREVQPKSPNGILRLPIDRVFTIKGFGTVATGTLISGTISIEQEIEILPKGIAAKVRGLQSHNQSVQRAIAGQRTAVNLQGMEKDDLSRGDTIVSKGFFTPTRIIDAAARILNDASRTLRTGSRIRFYNSTQEAIGRLVLIGKDELGAGQEGFVQFRLERPVVVQHGDRFIIRFYSPIETLGGGEVLDPHPRRHKRSNVGESLARLETLKTGTMEEKISVFVSGRGSAGMEESEIVGAMAADKNEIEEAASAAVRGKRLIRADTLYVHSYHVAALENRIISLVSDYHRNNPLKPGMDKEELKSALKARISQKVLNLMMEGLVKKKQLAADGSKLRLPEFKAGGGAGKELMERIKIAITKGGAQPPVREDIPGMFGVTEKEAVDIFRLISKDSDIARINDSILLSKRVVEKMMADLVRYLQEKKEITVSEFRDLAKTSRKYAVPILEYFDTQKVTQRVGDKRVMRG